MSNHTVASLTRISATELQSRLKTSTLFTPSTKTSTSTPAQDSSTPTPNPTTSSIAIIDVRDSDHIGGHIKGSTWVPSSELDFRIPELVRTLENTETVVFHCALSQQRGPKAALRYLRARKDKMPEKKQKVIVLEGGFVEWQGLYGTDKELTEEYDKGMWEFGGP